MTGRLETRDLAPGETYIALKAPPGFEQRYLDPKTGSEPRIDEDALIHDCILGAWTAVGARTFMSEVRLGDWSYLTSDAQAQYAEIGKFCSIARGTCLNPGNHPHWRAAMHHFSYRAKSYELDDKDHDEFFEWRRSHTVTVGHDVWIGQQAIVLPGRTIGTGAVIAAGAVVSKDVPPFTIVGGTPASPIKQRFDQKTQDQLMEIAWWDWPHAKIKENLADFQNFDAAPFIEKHIERAS